MRNNLLLSIFFLLLAHGLFAQGYQHMAGAQNYEEDQSKAVIQTNDGGFLYAGYSASIGAGSNDITLIKTNADGTTSWVKTYGGSYDERPEALVQTNDGGYAVVGYTESFGATSKDVYVLKVDTSGIHQWSRKIGGPNDDHGYGISLTQGGDIIVTGEVNGGGAGGIDIYLIKLETSTGNVLWKKTMGGAYDDMGYSITAASNGEFLVAGETGSFTNGVTNIYLLRIDSVGDTLWTASVGGSGINIGNSVKATSDGNFIIGGTTNTTGPGSYAQLLVKTDDSGTPLWGKVMGSSGLEYGETVTETYDGGFVIGGFSTGLGAGSNDGFVSKTDSSGNVLWSKTYGDVSDDKIHTIESTSDSGLVMTGYMYDFIKDDGGYEFFMAKTDENGVSTGCFQNTTTAIYDTINLQTINTSTLIGSTGTTDTTTTSVSSHSFPNYPVQLGLYMSTTGTLCDTNCQGTAAVTPCDQWNVCSGTSPYSYQWDANAGGATMDSVSGLCNGQYTVTVTDDNGCTGRDTAIIGDTVIQQSICMVTVDSTSTKNLIVWSKPNNEPSIDSFRVYRDITGTYTHVGSVHGDSLSQFVDTTQGVNPNITSYRYKISVVDSCGNESLLSDFHKTMHLQTSPGTGGQVNLSWTDYIGFTSNYYRIYRDDLGNGNWQVIDSTSFGITQYTDTPPSSNTLYLVEVATPDTCSATRDKNDYNSSISNSGVANPTSLEENELPGYMEIYPNPNNGTFKVEWGQVQVQRITIYNTIGSQVKEISLKEADLSGNRSIDLQKFPAGSYLIRMTGDNKVIRQQVMVK